MRCTEKDIDRVNKILSHESVFPWISDDGLGAESANDLGECFIRHPSCIVLSPNEYSAFIFMPQNMITFEVHTNILPPGRGKTAIMAGKAVIAWMFTETRCQKIVSWVPEFNRHTLFYALRCGIKKEGVSIKSFLKNGVLYDQTLVGITKGEWLCQ